MADYKKLELQRFSRNRIRETAEQRYWRQFKNPIHSEQIDRVTHLNFCPSLPHNLAVSSSTRVLIYDGNTGELNRTISRFTDIAYSGSFRSDGKLLVAGSANALVQIFDPSSRLVLRAFKGHHAPVQATRFCSDNLTIISASDDKTVRRWDMPTDKQISLFEGHKDYVRAARENHSDANLWITGSYDHTVKCWDVRTAQCVMTMDHGFPVEDILPMPTGPLVVSAGDNKVKVWDLVAGGRLVHTLSNHKKTITCLALDSSASRLLAGSLDQHIKFYDMASYQVIHTIKYPSPVLCMGISPNNSMLAVGMLNGALSMRKRVKQAKENAAEETAIAAGGILTTHVVSEQQRQQMIRSGSYRYFMRGANHRPAEDDFKVESYKKQKLQEYDQMLKKFQYRDALDAALKTRHAVVVSSMLDELLQRGGLRIALSGRDETRLAPLVKFLIRYIANPHFSELLADVANMVFDIYGGLLGQSIILDELFLRLKSEISQEVLLQKQLCRLIGSVDIMMTSSDAHSWNASGQATEAQAQAEAAQ